MKILVLDNYDSFTYNLVQYIQEILDKKIDVVRNDAIGLEAVAPYDAIVLSPGPGLPAESGMMPQLIDTYGASKAILGVCLGHQAIGEAFGGSLENLEQVYHGLETPIRVLVESDPLYRNIPTGFQAGRYHSWVVERSSLPDCFELTAVDDRDRVMGIRHKDYRLWGVQYHPESIMTTFGKQILENFFNNCV